MDELVLGRYRPVRRLGSGGMADVWLATDERTGGRVAVKRLHPHIAADPAMVERFRREAQAAAAVDHPNVIRVLEAGPDAIVLEHVDGESLAQRIRNGPLEPPLVENLGRDLASALAAVHAAGFVHRDVTPGNVIVDHAGVAHLMDFGIARPSDVANGVTATRDLMGTWRYAPPEVMAGAAATPASDVWALGATLYEALTGRPPYPATSPAELVEARQRPVPPIAGGALAALIPQMLDPDPERRPSAAVVSNVLATSPEAVTQVLPTAPGGPAALPDPVVVAPVRPTPPVAPWGAATPGGAPPSRVGSGPSARQVGVAAAGLVLAAAVVLAAASRADPAASGVPTPSGAPSGLTTSPSGPSLSSTPSLTAVPVGAPARGHGHGRGHHGK